jgi:hypothetical protein
MWMRQRRRAGCLTMLSVVLSAYTGTATGQQRAPSDDELHSMYCVEVLKAEITLQQHMISESSDAAGMGQPGQREQWIDTSVELLRQLAKLQGALYDLQAYMLPRIPAIDSFALASAIRQADADVEESKAVSGCENPTWLPLLHSNAKPAVHSKLPPPP